MIRQLNALEDTARHSAKIADDPGKRFFLNYKLLTDDIKRMSLGLEGYLTPSRAQPRVPMEVSESYTKQHGDS